MAERSPHWLASVPIQRRALHFAVHVVLLVLELGLVFALTFGAIVMLPAEVHGNGTFFTVSKVALPLATVYAGFLAIVTSAASGFLSRFSVGPLLIVAFHLLAVPVSAVLFAALNWKFIAVLLAAEAG